ncbi:MAG: hypothetical protein ACJ8M4_12270 [Chthoniobacterales bacterium]
MGASKRDRIIFVGAAILLVIRFVGLLGPTDEVPSSALRTLSLLMDIGLVIGVVGVGLRILGSLPKDASKAGWVFLLVVGAVAGIGIFGIRLSGGQRFELPSRTSQSSTRREGLPKQLHELFLSMGRRTEKFGSSRWGQALLSKDPAKIRTLTRADLREAREVSGELHENIQQILKIFAEAESKKIDLSTSSTEPPATRVETWRAAEEGINGTQELLGLIDSHWDEWLADPFATGSDVKPWQAEIMRLSNAVAQSHKKFQALVEPGTAPLPASGETAALQSKLDALVQSWGPLVMKIQHQRWLTTGGAERRKLPRKELLEAREILRSLLGYNDQVLAIFAEAQSKGIEIPKDREEPLLSQPEYWRAAGEAYRAFADSLNLIDQNFDEYVAHPSFPDAKGEQKPWQREILRLDDVRILRSKEMETLRDPAKGLLPELKALIESVVRDEDEINATRWAKAHSDATQRRTLTRQDTKDFTEIHGKSIERSKRIGELLLQAAKERIDVSAASTDRVLIQPEFWQTQQKMRELVAERLALREKHWDEWLAAGDPTTEKNLSPWQADLKRLIDEGDVTYKKLEAIIKRPPAVASTQVAPVPSLPRNGMEELALKTHLLPAVADYVQARDRLQQTRWIKTPDVSAFHPHKITGADLHEAGEKMRALIVTIDKVIADLSRSSVPVPAAETEYWGAKRETYVLFQELTKLLEDHWKEWHGSGIERGAVNLKPWQTEAVRLNTAIVKLGENKLISILL